MWVEPNLTWGDGWTTAGPWTEEVVVGEAAPPESQAGPWSWSAIVLATHALAVVSVADPAIDSQRTWYRGPNEFEPMTRSGTTTSFTYDANGNLDTKTGGWDYDWNPENLMTVAKLNGVPQQSYVYDGLGRRVKVDGTSASTWTVSIFSGMDPIYEKDQSGAITKYV